MAFARRLFAHSGIALYSSPQSQAQKESSKKRMTEPTVTQTYRCSKYDYQIQVVCKNDRQKKEGRRDGKGHLRKVSCWMDERAIRSTYRDRKGPPCSRKKRTAFLTKATDVAYAWAQAAGEGHSFISYSSQTATSLSLPPPPISEALALALAGSASERPPFAGKIDALC